MIHAYTMSFFACHLQTDARGGSCLKIYITLKTSLDNSNQVTEFLSNNSHPASFVEPFCLFIKLIYVIHSQTS